MKTFLLMLAFVAALTFALQGESLVRRVMRLVRGDASVLGEVLSIDKVAYGRGTYYGVRLLLSTEEGRMPVFLGPSWFVASQTMKITPHDRITVIGSRVSQDGKPALVAAEVKKGHERLRLRTPDGIPLWRGSPTH